MKLRDLRHLCSICRHHIDGDADVEIDHIIPRSRQGPDEAWNKRITHAACNRAKGTTIEVVQLPMLRFDEVKKRVGVNANDNEILRDFAPKEIRHLREQQRMSQGEFAALLGVALWTVSRWELGKVHPRNGILKQLDMLERQKNGA